MTNRKAVRFIPAAFFCVCSVLFAASFSATSYADAEANTVVAASLGPDSCIKPESAERVFIAKVNDGDTVKLLDGRSVRLLGINTPEMNHRDSTLAPEPFAVEATSALQAFIQRSSSLWISTDVEKKDHYSRVLAHLWNEKGESASSVLLRLGLGQQVVFPPNLSMAECYRAAENLARTNNLGLWKETPARLEQLEYPGTGFQLLSVEVTEVQKKGRTWWVEVKGPLVLRISALKSGFSRQQILAMPGKRFLVRGWVKARSRSVVQQGFKPYLMQIQHPMMMELE